MKYWWLIVFNLTCCDGSSSGHSSVVYPSYVYYRQNHSISCLCRWQCGPHQSLGSWKFFLVVIYRRRVRNNVENYRSESGVVHRSLIFFWRSIAFIGVTWIIPAAIFRLRKISPSSRRCRVTWCNKQSVPPPWCNTCWIPVNLRVYGMFVIWISIASAISD